MLLDKFTRVRKVNEITLLRNRHYLHIEFEDGTREILDCKNLKQYLKESDDEENILESRLHRYLHENIEETDSEFKTRMDVVLGISSE